MGDAKSHAPPRCPSEDMGEDQPLGRGLCIRLRPPIQPKTWEPPAESSKLHAPARSTIG
jgi:hypothetical protein